MRSKMLRLVPELREIWSKYMDLQILLTKYQVPDSSMLEYLMQKYWSGEPEKLDNPVKPPKKQTSDCLHPDEQ